MAKTSTQIQVNKEAVRLLVEMHGQREGARLAGLNEDTVCSWAYRYGWKVASKSQANGHSALVDNVASELAKLESETRTSLARSAARMSKDAEQATLRDSPYVHKAAQVAGIAFKWRDDEKPSHFTLNQLNINTLSIDETPSLDA